MTRHTVSRLPLILLLVCILIPVVQGTGELWSVPSTPGEDLSVVALSQDGSTIVAGGDQLIVLTPDGKKLWSGWSGTTIDMSRDGRYIVTSQGQTVRLFSREGIKLWDQSPGGTVVDVSILPDAAIVVAGGGNTVQSWYNSGAGLGRNTTETVNDVRISPVRDQIVVSTAKALRSYNLSYVPIWYDDTISPGAIAMSGDGTAIVIPNGNHIRMYHSSGTLLWDRTYPGGSIVSLAYSRDGSTIVAGRDDSSVLAIDREGTLLWTAKAGYWVSSVGVSDDGSVIATGSIDRQVHVYDRQGTLLGTATTESAIKSRSVAVSGDGSLIVAVDLSHVYGYSLAQFEGPAANASATTIVPGTSATTVPVTAVTSSPSPVPSAAAPVTTTPSLPFPLAPVFAAVGLAVLAGRRAR